MCFLEFKTFSKFSTTYTDLLTLVLLLYRNIQVPKSLGKKCCHLYYTACLLFDRLHATMKHATCPYNLTTYLNNDYDMHCILNYLPLCFICCTDFSWHLQDRQKITAIIENYCDIKAMYFPSFYQFSLYPRFSAWEKLYFSYLTINCAERINSIPLVFLVANNVNSELDCAFYGAF